MAAIAIGHVNVSETVFRESQNLVRAIYRENNRFAIQKELPQNVPIEFVYCGDSSLATQREFDRRKKLLGARYQRLERIDFQLDPSDFSRSAEVMILHDTSDPKVEKILILFSGRDVDSVIKYLKGRKAVLEF